MTLIKVIATILGVVVFLATLIPLLKKEQWWIRIFDFPRVQIVVLGMISLILFAFAFQQKWSMFAMIFIVMAALIYQFIMIYPYTPLAKKEVLKVKNLNNHPVFSIMIMNVYIENRNAAGAMKIIVDNHPDILIAVETDRWWNNKLSELKKDYPYHVLVPLENSYGMVLYSKLRLVNPKIKYVYEPDVPSIHTEVQLKSGENFKLYAVHPKPPAPGHSNTSTLRDAELLRIGKETRNDKTPVIVAGDLNDVAWSFTTNLFQRYSELLDPRVGRGMFNTFHAKHRLFRWPLDHIFHSDHFQLVDIKTLPYYGSDHFPIFAKLCYMPNHSHQQEEPEADEDDMRQAHEKII